MRAIGTAVLVAHGNRPDATGHPADNIVFRIQSVGEEKRKVRGKAVNRHPSGQVIFNIGKSIGQGEGQLSDGIRASLGDMIPGYGYRIKVTDVFCDKVLLNVTHHLQCKINGKDAGILSLVLF